MPSENSSTAASLSPEPRRHPREQLPPYELTRLDANTFEHLANSLALKVLGAGHTGFGPGPDGGRDGLFQGVAPYPSQSDCWGGVWYIQSKFMTPHLGKDPQQWLIEKVREELSAFSEAGSKRRWPDNWILVTNVEPSGAPGTGSFDKTRELVTSANAKLDAHFHIWGGKKVLDLLSHYPDIAAHYAEFVTPGDVLCSIRRAIEDNQAQSAQIIRHFVVTQFIEQQHTKLEQAGSPADNRPGIHRLFSDIPIKSNDTSALAAQTLTRALAQNHRITLDLPNTPAWKMWQCDPSRARIWVVKGGPGQGKSTFTQYVSQIQRAAIILAARGGDVTPSQSAVASEVFNIASRIGLWPLAPRIPVTLELKDYAKWYGIKSNNDHENSPPQKSKKLVYYIAKKLEDEIGENVSVGTLRSTFAEDRWVFVFDGLDEVPSDVKDDVAKEIVHFVDDFLVGCKCEASIVCTSRPQGYSGQFGDFDAATIDLAKLSPEQALACAKPLLEIDRSPSESRAYLEILVDALHSPAIAERWPRKFGQRVKLSPIASKDFDGWAR